MAQHISRLPRFRAATALPAASLAAAAALARPRSAALSALVDGRVAAGQHAESRWPHAVAGALAALSVAFVAVAPRTRRRLGQGVARSSKAIAADPEEAGKHNGQIPVGALLAILLYASNVSFNVLNKQVLNMLPEYPLSNTVLHFGVGSLLAAFAWMFRLQQWPFPLSPGAAWRVAPLAVLHCAAILFTNIAVSKVNLSLVHTIKAAEPLYAAILSFLILGSMPSATAVGALALIMLGVMGASVSEVSFNVVGFLAAMGSNLGFCLKNVLSKQLQVSKQVDELNLISLLTLGAFLLGLPVAVLAEGPALRAVLAAPPAPLSELLLRACASGALFHIYQIASILILYRASPVTHSVVNLMKRPALIVLSVLFFNTAVSSRNALGVCLALFGSYLYGRAIQRPTRS